MKFRKKNKLKIILDSGAYIPVRGHKDDAGLDLRTPWMVVIPPHSSKAINTGVHVEIPSGYVGMLKSKSGLNVYSGILSEGVIDAGYTGSIVAKLYNHSDKPVRLEEGDKITQLVIMPVYIPDALEVVEKFEKTERGDGGFGSTGR